MLQTVKRLLAPTPIGRLGRSARLALEESRGIRRWRRDGRPLPPPHSVKVCIVKAYARRHRPSVFVETGTYMGDMVFAVKDRFDEIYTIELNYDLYERARERFAPYPRIHVLHGDSAQVLPGVLAANRKQRILFWLDAHYSGGQTARGDTDTPIMAELLCIGTHLAVTPVILIDDARMFTGQSDYPQLSTVEAYAHRHSQTFTVEHDVIRIV